MDRELCSITKSAFSLTVRMSYRGHQQTFSKVAIFWLMVTLPRKVFPVFINLFGVFRLFQQEIPGEKSTKIWKVPRKF